LRIVSVSINDKAAPYFVILELHPNLLN
jgi:hypothetical protein